MSTAATQLDPVTANINRTVRALQAIRDMSPEDFWRRAGITRGTYYNRMSGRRDWTAQEVKRHTSPETTQRYILIGDERLRDTAAGCWEVGE